MMTSYQQMDAYAATAERYSLKHHQRTALDNSTDYTAIMFYAHHQRWNIVEMFLKDNNII